MKAKKAKFEELQEAIGYHFQDDRLLRQAITHSSYANEKNLGKIGSNERLEYLGDAVLELVSSEFFYHKYREKPEGELTKLRASFVCEPSLSHCAKELSLGKYILLGKGEEATGGRERNSVLADALEALIGAIYLDGGFSVAKETVHRIVLQDIENKHFFYDNKTVLQEEIQKEGLPQPEYILLSESGPDHRKVFHVSVQVSGKELARASGKSKKMAEQLAAQIALKRREQV